MRIAFLLGILLLPLVGVATLTSTVTAADKCSGESRVLPVTTTELWRAYAANEFAANHLYKYAVLLVTGTVDSVRKDSAGAVSLRLRSPDRSSITVANLEYTAYDDAKAIRKGQTVVLRCIGGGRVLGSPVLNLCVFDE